MGTSNVTHRRVATNGIELHVAECGPADGRPVVLCHGFPELWYSWRHQLPVLAAAGYRAIAPDLRGYGDCDHPDRVEDYGIGPLAADLLGLVDELGANNPIFVGHDWGALIVWDLARLHPERVSAMCAMSVPLFAPPAPPTEMFERLFKDQFFYILYFQEVGPAEEELARDPRVTMRRMLWSISGAALAGRESPLAAPRPREGTGFLDTLADPPDQLPDWLTEEDVDYYAASFRRSGFFGPVSYYRNLDANWQGTKDIPIDTISMPSCFIGGALDPVIGRSRAGIKIMEELPDFRGATLIEGAGHWNQQEKADETNAALLEFL